MACRKPKAHNKTMSTSSVQVSLTCRSACTIASYWKVVLIALLVGAAGCAQPLNPIFPPLDSPQVWPAHPLVPRVQYVGELRSDSDLGRRPTFLQAVGNLFSGERDPEMLYGPRDVVSLASIGCLWIADPGGRCVHLFDLKRRQYVKIHAVAGEPLFSPIGLARGPGKSVYVCDSQAVSVFRLDGRDGTLLEEVPLPSNVTRPVAIYYDFAADELFVVDSASHDIKVLDRSGLLKRVVGHRGSGIGEFNFPVAISSSKDGLWVVDAGNHRIQRLAMNGVSATAIGQAGDSPGDLALPKDVAFDSDGNAYVVDARFENVQIFNRDGTLLLFLGSEGNGLGEFWLPGGIDIDENDRIWVCDTYNGRIQVFDYLRQPSPKGAD